MRKSLLLFLIGLPFCLAAYSQSYCNKQAPKISFTGKSIWSIDGQITDWQSILGPYTGNIAAPFAPEQTAAFNWVIDKFIAEGADRDAPPPQSDVHFLSFTHDDYNVYFYFRRQASSSDPNTFYYFVDVNADGVMNNGEPVIHATFTDNAVSALTLSRYVVNTSSEYYAPKQGNWMVKTVAVGPPEQNIFSTFDGIDNFPMTGSLVEVFNSNKILPNEKPKQNEIFSAAITENGFGIELAVPWSYLRSWIVEKSNEKNNGQNAVKYAETTPLNPGDIFFYHVSMQAGAGAYNPASVEDNAGSCGGGVGISGNVDLAKSISTTVVDPGSQYKFNLSYTNLTNAATEVDIQRVKLNIRKTSELPVIATDFTVTIYPDNNCNGVVDAGETPFNFNYLPNVEYIPATNSYEAKFSINGFDGALITLPPFGIGCFIAVVTLPPNGSVNNFRISFETAVFFVEGKEPCEPSCGGKPINQVGFVEEEVTGDDAVTTINKKAGLSEGGGSNSADVLVYPNPGRGTTNIRVPQTNKGVDIILEDNLGRIINRWNSYKQQDLQINNLKSGYYIVRTRIKETGKWITKKIIVQR